MAPLKMVASAITIGSGRAAGREGPTALNGAGFGSVYARLRHRSDEERRLLVVIGMGAGLSVIFRSPIGTALFAIEVLYGSFEFEGSALLYSLIASLVAYVGGYRLLGTAAPAVLISYLVQTRLASFLNLKYRSMYEAQVHGRAQSPAPYAEYVRLGLNLLEKQHVQECSIEAREKNVDIVAILRGSEVLLPNLEFAFQAGGPCAGHCLAAGPGLDGKALCPFESGEQIEE